MQQCTAMLRERMGSDPGALQQAAAGGAPRPSSSMALACAPSTPTSLMRREDRAPSSPPDTALEAMGPVLESVLGSLTQVGSAALHCMDSRLQTISSSMIVNLAASLECSRRNIAKPWQRKMLMSCPALECSRAVMQPWKQAHATCKFSF